MKNGCYMHYLLYKKTELSSGNNIFFSVENLIQIRLVRLEKSYDSSKSEFPVLQNWMLRISMMGQSDLFID